MTHPLPHVDEIIAWATILDANSSFGKFHSQNTQSFYKIYNGIWFQQTPIWDYHAKLSKNKWVLYCISRPWGSPYLMDDILVLGKDCTLQWIGSNWQKSPSIQRNVNFGKMNLVTLQVSQASPLTQPTGSLTQPNSLQRYHPSPTTTLQFNLKKISPMLSVHFVYFALHKSFIP